MVQGAFVDPSGRFAVRAERLRVAAPRFGTQIASRLDFDSEFDCEFEFASDFQWIPVSACFVFPVGLRCRAAHILRV